MMNRNIMNRGKKIIRNKNNIRINSLISRHRMVTNILNRKNNRKVVINIQIRRKIVNKVKVHKLMNSNI